MAKRITGLLGAPALAAISAIALTPTMAGAATVITPTIGVLHPTPGQTIDFFVSGNITNGPIAATFGDTGIPAGSFTDEYQFTIPQTGTGSGSLSTTVTANGVGGPNDLDISSVSVNGILASAVYRDALGAICFTPGSGTCGATETFAVTTVPIAANFLNTITVTGLSRGNGSYGGNANFLPAVPEPATWAMMLLGFGAIGMAVRRNRKRLPLAQLA